MFLIYFVCAFDASIFLVVAASSLSDKVALFVIFEMSSLEYSFYATLL